MRQPAGAGCRINLKKGCRGARTLHAGSFFRRALGIDNNLSAYYTK